MNEPKLEDYFKGCLFFSISKLQRNINKMAEDAFKESGLAPNHAFHRHRNWMVKYGNRFYFNPAIDAVKQHLIQVIKRRLTQSTTGFSTNRPCTTTRYRSN